MKNPILIAVMLFYCVAANAEIKKVVKSVKYEYEINNSDSSEFGLKRWYPHDMDECAFDMCLMNDKLYILDASYKNVKILDMPTQSKKGQKANMNQAEIDHITPKSKGGTNSSSNAQVLSKEENLKKGNRINE